MKNYLATASSISQHIAAGYGQGQGCDYKPWLEIRHVPSLGKSSRVKGWKTQRVHNFLSGLELSYFYLLEWNDRVIDIQEQFPLLPQKEITEICQYLGIRPPRAPGAKVDVANNIICFKHVAWYNR